MMKKLILTAAFSVFAAANIYAQTAQQVVDNYITALGGRQKLEAIKTVSMKNTISVMGMNMEGRTLKKDNKFKTTQTMMGQEMVQVFDGQKGYAKQMGQTIEFPADQLAKLKTNKIIDALALEASKVKSVEKKQLDGKDFYLLTSDDYKSYFDTKTGLLYKTENDKGTMTITKYADVGGVKFAEEMSLDAAGQHIDIKNSDIRINEPISDDEFKL